MLFARVDDATAAAMAEDGLLFYAMGRGQVRFVTSFQTTSVEVDDVLLRIGRALAVSV